jgi:4-hydroxy-3-methylbut-2-enyl diphosphate reductase
VRVEVARHAGICYGVERALELAQAAAEKGGDVHTLGPLIHNPQAVDALRRQGVEVATRLDQVDGGQLVIRSHGVGPETIERARERGLEVVDATCPHVSKAHQAAQRLRAEGYAVIIVGEADHPEFEGIMAYAGGDAIVVESADELPQRLPSVRVGVVVQTTQSASRLVDVVEALVSRTKELRVFNTICSATEKRQRAAQELASGVDAIVVVGGRNSGNTARLVELCRERNARVYHVETADELEPGWFEDAEAVGVTAGASTPEEQIAGVVAAIEAMD